MFKEYNSSNHAMLDLETFGSDNSSVITSLAIVIFNPYTGETLDSLKVDIDIQSSLDYGATVNGSTLVWWLGQSEGARNTLIEGQKNALDLKKAMQKVHFFLLKNFDVHEVKLWGNGSSFDLSILSNSFKLVGMPETWKHYNERDVRTIVAFNPEIKDNLVFEGVKHDPLADCLFQIQYMSIILKSIQPVPAKSLSILERFGNYVRKVGEKRNFKGKLINKEFK